MTCRLRAIVGHSARLRDEALAGVTAAWNGPVQVVSQPDAQRLVLDLDTPPLFGEPPLLIVRCDDKWTARHEDVLLPLAGQAATAGAAVLVCGRIEDQRSGKRLARALTAAESLLRADPPWHGVKPSDALRQCEVWVVTRLQALPQGCDRPREVAQALVEHVGADADALLNAIDVLATWAGDEPVSPAGLPAVAAGVGERPVWEFTGAVLEAEVQSPGRRALGLLHAGQGADPHQAIAALVNELRRTLACCELDEHAAGAAVGAKGSMWHAVKRARALGRATVARLLADALTAQRRLRRGGTDAQLTCELLVLHAQRLLTGGRRELGVAKPSRRPG